jgi:hypothetical protein
MRSKSEYGASTRTKIYSRFLLDPWYTIRKTIRGRRCRDAMPDANLKAIYPMSRGWTSNGPRTHEHPIKHLSFSTPLRCRDAGAGTASILRDRRSTQLFPRAHSHQGSRRGLSKLGQQDHYVRSEGARERERGRGQHRSIRADLT